MHPLGILLLKRYSHSDSFCTFSSESVQFIIGYLTYFFKILSLQTEPISRAEVHPGIHFTVTGTAGVAIQ